MRRSLLAGLALPAYLLLVCGCGSGGIPPGGYSSPGGSTPGPSGPVGIVTGNWQIAVNTNAANAPIQALTGSILQSSAATNGVYALSSVLHIASGPGCFAGLTTLPSTGSLSGTSLSLTSFPLESQVLGLTPTTTNVNASFAGPFSISGGCATGVSGTVSGQRISALSGAYTGPWQDGTGTHSVAVTPVQDTFADGLGYFHLSGTATFSNVTCFTSGKIDAAASTISGQQVSLRIIANDGSTALLTGTTDVAAAILTISSLQVTSTLCGTTSTAVLTH